MKKTVVLQIWDNKPDMDNALGEVSDNLNDNILNHVHSITMNMVQNIKWQLNGNCPGTNPSLEEKHSPGSFRI